MGIYKDTPMYTSNDSDYPVMACVMGMDVELNVPVMAGAPSLTYEEADAITGIQDVIETMVNNSQQLREIFIGFDINNPNNKQWVTHVVDKNNNVIRFSMIEPRELINHIRTVEKKIGEALIIPPQLEAYE